MGDTRKRRPRKLKDFPVFKHLTALIEPVLPLVVHGIGGIQGVCILPLSPSYVDFDRSFYLGPHTELLKGSHRIDPQDLDETPEQVVLDVIDAINDGFQDKLRHVLDDESASSRRKRSKLIRAEMAYKRKLLAEIDAILTEAKSSSRI